MAEAARSLAENGFCLGDELEMGWFQGHEDADVLVDVRAARAATNRFARLLVIRGFELEGVSSLTIDPHKMGLSSVAAGALLYRFGEYLEKITVDAPYLISMKHSTLLGTRNSAAVAATYAVLRNLGRAGFREIVIFHQRLDEHSLFPSCSKFSHLLRC